MRMPHLSDGTVLAIVRRRPLLCDPARRTERPLTRRHAARLLGTLRCRFEG